MAYSLAVAVFDFVPVAVALTGMVILARAISTASPALAGIAWSAAVLIPLGGFCKASWKLTVAASGVYLDWLENLLFILLAPGFTLMAFALFHASRARLGQTLASPERLHLRALIWILPVALGASLAALLTPDTRLWVFWLLAMTTVANITLVAHALRFTHRHRLGTGVAALFIYSLLATLALGGLSRLPPGETTAWIQETVNLTAQASLALGLWHLTRVLHAPQGPAHAPRPA